MTWLVHNEEKEKNSFHLVEIAYIPFSRLYLAFATKLHETCNDYNILNAMVKLGNGKNKIIYWRWMFYLCSMRHDIETMK